MPGRRSCTGTSAPAERERFEQRLEAFRTAAAEALDLAGRAAPASRDDGEDLGSASRPKLGKMVAKVIEAKGASERFGPVGLSKEVNRRFGHRLRKPADSRQVSVVLRRMHRLGRIHLARQGRPYWEALYVRERPAAGG